MTPLNLPDYNLAFNEWLTSPMRQAQGTQTQNGSVIPNWMPQTAMRQFPMASQGQVAGASPTLAPVVDAVATPVNQGLATQFNNWMQNSGILGSTNTQTGIRTDGWGGAALGALQTLGGLGLGIKQYKLASDALKTQKRFAETNLKNQVTTTNAALRDRQAARVASNPGGYQSVSEYMEQNGVRA